MADEHIEQVFVSFDAEQDRLLLRVATSRTEISAWLSRRIVRELWPGLVAALADADASGRALDAQAREAVVAFRHEQAVARSNFVQQYRPDGVTPAFGAQVPLVTGIRTAGEGSGDGRQVAVTLKVTGGHEATLRLGPELAHGLCKLVADAARRAQWDLDLRIGRESAQTAGDGHAVN